MTPPGEERALVQTTIIPKPSSEYEPDSLRVMLASLDRHFQENRLPFRKDKPFEASRRTLNGKAVELHEAGLGKRKNKADVLTEEDEETL